MSRLLTLDTAGYIRDPALIIDRVLRNFFVSNYTQTNVHYGQIKSLPYLISMYSQNMIGLGNAVKRAVEELLSAHFDRVEATVKVDIFSLSNGSEEHEIIIDVICNRGIYAYSAGKLLKVVKNRISQIEDKD